MKHYLATVILIVGLWSSQIYSKEVYTAEHDDLDIEKIAADEALLRSYLICFRDDHPCDEVQSHFKKDLAEAVREACAKCTSAQKHIMKVFVGALQSKLPKGYDEFKKKYDPEDKYFNALSSAISNY